MNVEGAVTTGGWWGTRLDPCSTSTNDPHESAATIAFVVTEMGAPDLASLLVFTVGFEFWGVCIFYLQDLWRLPKGSICPFEFVGPRNVQGRAVMPKEIFLRGVVWSM